MKPPFILVLELNQEQSYLRNEISKAALRNRFSDVKLLIIDELSMVSSDLWKDIDSRLGEIFVTIPEKELAGLSVMTVADFLQLHPVR